MNSQSTLVKKKKSRNITLPTKVCLVKAMVFPVVMYGCASWTVKKAECRRTDDFELWCWKRLLRVSWTARRSNQSILKEISPGCSFQWTPDWCWSWNSNTLATWCEELTHWKRPWCWEGLGAGGEGDDKGWDGWMASPTRWTWVWVNSGSCRWTGKPGVLRFMGLQSRTWLSYWTELNWSENSESESEVAQSPQTLCDHMDCNLPGSSVHGIFQARVLEWVAISFSKGSSWPRDLTEPVIQDVCSYERKFSWSLQSDSNPSF